jgi:hypothetical protein
MKSLLTDRLAGEEAGEAANRVPVRGRLFRKYVALFVAPDSSSQRIEI